jgi:hypothetical protein
MDGRFEGCIGVGEAESPPRKVLETLKRCRASGGGEKTYYR